MTDITYISNRPGFWDRVKITLDIIGYSRAATALSTYGYFKEAERCVEKIKELKSLY